jgi:hypothetical protein
MIIIQMTFGIYYGDINMNQAPTNPTAGKSATETKQIVLKEIGAKWSKFSEKELSALTGKDDLVTQVVAKYGLEKPQAQRDVDALLKGRQI